MTEEPSTTRRQIPLKAYIIGLIVVIALASFIGNRLPFGTTEVADHFNRAATYEQQDRWGAAIEEYNQIIQLDPQNARAYNNRGFAYFSKGDRDQAIADYDRAIALGAENAQVYINRGQAHRFIGDYKQAIADLDKAIALDPKSASAAVYVERGISYIQLLDLQQALVEVNKAIELDPQFAIAYLYRGLINMGLRQREEAIADLEKSLDLGLEPDVRKQAEDLLMQLKQ
jgi:tetratricopeptide (TPR) repeat protein